jgi:hypothetical protein
MRSAAQATVEVIAPCMIGTDDAARKLSADWAGIFKRHEFGAAVPADVVESA